MSGLAIALIGSGEFDPWAEEVDRWLLERSRTGDGRVLIAPTASAAEGDDVFDGWCEKGLEHYARMGVAAEVLPLKTREDAAREDLVAKLDAASLIFFSGGNPAYLAATLLGTALWRALVERLDRGLAYGGCSAGMVCLCELTPDSEVEELSEEIWKPGLSLFREVAFGPHWDALDSWVPGAREFIIEAVPPGWHLLAVEENTAAVGDGSAWEVLGSGAAHTMLDGNWERHASGSSFSLPLTRGDRTA